MDFGSRISISSRNFFKCLIFLEEAIFLLVIGFLPVYFAFFQENYNAFELNKITFFRVLVIMLLLIFLLKISLRGALKIYPKLFLLILFLGLAYFISSYFSIHPRLSFEGSYARQQGFYSLVSYLLFYYLLIDFFSENINNKIKRVIISAILFSVFVCLYGFLQFAGLDFINWKENVFDTGRIFSSLGQPNFLGQYLILIIPITVYSLFIFRSFLSRFFILILIFLQTASLAITYSRSAWLGLITTIGTFALLALIAKGFKKIALTLFFLGIIFFPLIIFLSTSSFSEESLKEVNLYNRAKSIFDLNTGSNKIRLLYWEASREEFKISSWKRRMIGYGPETLSEIFVKYYTPEWGMHEKLNTFPDQAHNTPIDIILQFGILGLAAIISFLTYIFFKVFKYFREAKGSSPESWLVITLVSVLAGYFVNNFFSFSLTVGYVYYYMFLAVITAICLKSENNFKLFLRNRIFQVLILLVFLLTSGVFIYYYNFQPWLADHYYLKVLRAASDLDCRSSMDNMEKAVSLNPTSIYYKEQYIFHNLNCFEAVNSDQSRHDLYQNINSMIKSIGTNEYGFYTLLNLAHAEGLFGFYIDKSRYEEAEKYYERLLDINSYITTIYRDLGRLKLWKKEYDKAIEYFQKSEDSFPDFNSPLVHYNHQKEIKEELMRLYEMRGLAHFERGEKISLLYYNQALKFNPYYLPIYKKIADVYYKQGDIDQAIWYNKRGYQLNSKDYNWPLAIALLYKEKGDKAMALSYAELALGLSPVRPELKDIVESLKYE